MGVGVGGWGVETVEQLANSKGRMANKIHLRKDFRVDIGDTLYYLRNACLQPIRGPIGIHKPQPGL